MELKYLRLILGLAWIDSMFRQCWMKLVGQTSETEYAAAA
jgi:hypothetical protein